MKPSLYKINVRSGVIFTEASGSFGYARTMTNAIARFTLMAATAAALFCAQQLRAQDPVMPHLAGRQWVKAEPYFTAAAPAVPAERAWRLGPAFAIDSQTAPAVSGREWQLSSRMRFSIETASYQPSRLGMVAGLPTRDTAAAARFEFRF